MRRLVLLIALVLPLAAQAQALNLKVGAWEMTLKGTLMPKPMVYQECIAKADLADMMKGPDKDDDCKPVKAPSMRAQTWVGDMACSEGTLHVEFTADSPETLHAVYVQTSKQGKATMDLAGRWLGASCAAIKP